MGRVAARKTRPVCMAEPVSARTITPSAIWCSRSPKTLIVPASQKAGEAGVAGQADVGVLPDRAARGLGGRRRSCRCMRLRPTRTASAAELKPGPMPEPTDDGSVDAGRVRASRRPLLGSWPRAPERDHAAVRVGRAARDGGEEEPAHARREQHVAEADDVGEDGQGDRDDVAERPAREQELEAELVGEQDVERGREVGSREAGHLHGRHVDRHVAAVEERRRSRWRRCRPSPAAGLAASG